MRWFDYGSKEDTWEPDPAIGIWPASILASTNMRPLWLADLLGFRNALIFFEEQRECTSENGQSEYGMHMRWAWEKPCCQCLLFPVNIGTSSLYYRMACQQRISPQLPPEWETGTGEGEQAGGEMVALTNEDVGSCRKRGGVAGSKGGGWGGRSGVPWRAGSRGSGATMCVWKEETARWERRSP